MDPRRAVIVDVNRKPPLSVRIAAPVLIAAYFAAWYWPGVFGGRIYAGEDIVGVFYSLRNELYTMLHGRGLSWWDPVMGLGMPRLGNSQAGYLSPVSLLFYLIPPLEVFRVYPALIVSLIGLSFYLLMRVRGLHPLPSLAGALSWSTVSIILGHVEHPPAVEALLWLPATLAAWEMYRRSGRGPWAVAAALGVTFQVLAGYPQYLLYNALVMAVWVARDLYDLRMDVRVLRQRTLAALAIGGAGYLLGCWQLLPFVELARLSQRSLLNQGAFADTFRLAAWEVPYTLVGEVFWVTAPRPYTYGAPYLNGPMLSVVTLLLALPTLVGRRRRLWEWGAVAFFLAGTLGSAGWVLPLLNWLLPLTTMMRTPLRFIVPAAFLLSWLAALGLHRWMEGSTALPPWKRLAAALAVVVYLGAANWLLKQSTGGYMDAQDFQVSEVVRSAAPRISMDQFHSSRDIPPFSFNSGVVAGVPTLMLRDAIWPRNYFEALFASQYGRPDPQSPPQQKKLNILIAQNIFPVVHPSLPLMRAYGLSTLVRYTEGRYQAVPLVGANPRFYLATRPRVVGTPEERWAAAAATDWDPRLDVLVDEPVQVVLDRSVQATTVSVALDTADRQVVDVTSGGGVLVVSDLFYPGWKVTVDGQPCPLIQANLALRGVVVPPGTHRVEWVYHPAWLPAALACTAVAAFLLLALLRWPTSPSSPSTGEEQAGEARDS